MDCQLTILDNLNLTELISIAEINQYFKILASDVFRRKYSKRTASIYLPYVKCKEMYEPETNEYFQIAHVEVAAKMLKYFGHLIQSLSVQIFSGITAENELIKKFINLYCSETLIEIDIRNYQSPNVFESMTKPFKMVQKVSLHGKFDQLNNSKLISGEIFPALRQLTTALSVKLNDINIIGHFQHLERVIADFTTYENEEVCIAEYKRLITMNPQIRSLSLIHSTQELLKFSAENLDRLETLELEYYEGRHQDESIAIHFKNVKHFKIIGISINIPNKISFGRLIEFETGGFPKSCWKWIDFVEEYKNLEKFRLNDCLLRNQDVLRLAQAELNADEILFQCDWNINIRSIAKLIENSKHLRKVHLVQLHMTKSILEELQWSFNEWNIIEFTSEILLEKRN